ncbi:cytosine permease [Spongorhabdus nitratireducens]
MALKEAESHAISVIPEQDRLGWKAPLFNFMGVNICMSALMGGGILIQQFSLQQAILISISGNLILALMAFLTGYIGSHRGLSTYIITNQVFGSTAGKYLISMVLAISSCGWFGIQTSISALSLQKIYPSIDFTLAAIALGSLMTFFAAAGFRFMALSNYLGIPLLLGLMIWGVVITLHTNTLGDLLQYQPANQGLSITQGINMIIGLFVVSSVVASDVTRYTRTSKDVMLVAGIGMGVVCTAQQICASILAINTPTWDITQTLADLGFGWSAFMIILLASLSSNIVNAYGVGLALKNIFTSTARFNLTLLAGCIGTFFAASGIINTFIEFLTWLGILIPSIVGVIWVDCLIFANRSESRSAHSDASDLQVNGSALTGWLTGAATSWLCSIYDIGIPTITGILVSALVYFGLNMVKIRCNLSNS